MEYASNYYSKSVRKKATNMILGNEDNNGRSLIRMSEKYKEDRKRAFREVNEGNWRSSSPRVTVWVEK